MTKESMNAWVAAQKVCVLHSSGGTGLALEWGDYVSANNRRHLTVLIKQPGLEACFEGVRQFCKMHNLSEPSP